ncbi:MAG: OmpH family outer membrane protein [bacterium]
MKKFYIIALFALTSVAVSAQKYALVDMDYVMSAIPAYETANEQLDMLSKKWQAEVEALLVQVQTMYKNYQTEIVFLTDEAKTDRENQIIAKEKEANDLKRTYFGTEGELYKKREALVKPIQDEIYNAIQELSNTKGYDLIFDKASSSSIVFAAPKIDISDELLEKLGYSK